MQENDTNKRIALLNGNIAKAFFWHALPKMGSSLVHMAYTLFATMWVGQIGNQAVTAVGTAGSFMWIGQGIAMIPQLGGQIMSGQSIGEDNLDKARRFARMSIQLVLLAMTVFAIASIIFRTELIAFFNLQNQETIEAAKSYLFIVSFGHPIMGFNFVMQGLLTATGDSKTAFKLNATGMVLNIILDPLLIFGVGFFPELGVNGAAIATLFAETVVAVLFYRFIRRDAYLFGDFDLFEKLSKKELVQIIKLGTPPAIMNIGFATISMTISRIIVAYGESAIAIQKIGGQIESVTWMSSDGFAVAMNAFIAQNYGAGKKERVKRGFNVAMLMMTIYGAIVTAILIIGAVPIFDIFINDEETILGGANYLRIVGLSELGMCYEIVVSGAFNGLGETKFPAATCFLLTLARIPACLIFGPIFGTIDVVWWAISLSSILKGIVLLVAYIIRMRKYMSLSSVLR